MNLTELKIKIEEATKQAFLEIFKKYGKEGIYAFALNSDEGAMTVCPSTNTIKHLDKQAAEDPEEFLDYKFEPAEWKYEMKGADKLFNGISNFCRETVLALEEHDRTNEKEFGQFKEQLYETCISVLEKLRSENFFKQIVGEDVFLFFSISDFEFSKKDMKSIFTRLNGEKYKSDFLKWLKTL